MATGVATFTIRIRARDIGEPLQVDHVFAKSSLKKMQMLQGRLSKTSTNIILVGSTNTRCHGIYIRNVSAAGTAAASATLYYQPGSTCGTSGLIALGVGQWSFFVPQSGMLSGRLAAPKGGINYEFMSIGI